jgi:hypothetical protein
MHIHAIAATSAAAAVTFTTIGFTRSATVTTHNMIVFTIKKMEMAGKSGYYRYSGRQKAAKRAVL